VSDEIYRLENVPLFEAMYGPGLISLGGYEAIDEMFVGMDLKGQKVLDVGSGIGGMALHLSKQHGTFVTGLEVHPWMARYASDKAQRMGEERVEFICYAEDGRIPLPAKSLDIACSKGVLTNVEDKKALFADLFKRLRSGGRIVLIDWIGGDERGPKFERLSLGAMSFKETANSYCQILRECGFHDLSLEDKSASYLRYVKELILRLDSHEHRTAFSSVIVPSLREKIIQTELDLQHSIERGEQISALIMATA
jgi:SAM-dependent methyltransferase